MPFEEGHKLSPGRPKGAETTLNRAKLLIARLNDAGMDTKYDHPLTWMYLVAVGEKKLTRQVESIIIEDGVTPELRVACMKEVAQYICPKLKALEHKGEIDINANVVYLDNEDRNA